MVYYLPNCLVNTGQVADLFGLVSCFSFIFLVGVHINRSVFFFSGDLCLLWKSTSRCTSMHKIVPIIGLYPSVFEMMQLASTQSEIAKGKDDENLIVLSQYTDRFFE